MTSMLSITGERCRETPGGAVITSKCIGQHQAGSDAVWTLWQDSVGTEPIGTRIELAVHKPGEGWQSCTEDKGFPRDDCPLPFLARGAVVDRDWRDRVWTWHEQQLAADAEKGD